MSGAGCWVGIDVGGTFVDILSFDMETGALQASKHRSSRKEAAAALCDGLRAHLASSGQTPHAVLRLVHGTTLVTNILIERGGARVGMLTTAGFRDVLEIGRMRRPHLYDLYQDKPRPLADRRARVEIAERLDRDGVALVQPTEDDLQAAIAALRELDVEAVAVCFLNSYVDPVHEELVGEALRDAGFHVSLSSKVSAEYGEFERFATAVANSYVMPAAHAYLTALTHGLAALEVPARLQVMQSNGGVIGPEVAAQFPVRLATSGPAAGVIGAAILAAAAGFRDLITLDMGGTSTDVSLVSDGEPAYASEYEIAGYPVRAVGVDIQSIGAGGGSLAALDRTGALQVGPASAGADPGPACYGWGGLDPAVADADLVLGYLNTERFCGGELELRPDLAAAAINERIARPREVVTDEAALGILRVCITNMVGAVRNITMERGHDPRDFALAAFGGAGPVHAAFVAAELNIPTVLVLRDPGLLSAKGLLLTNYRADIYRTLDQPLAEVAVEGLNGLFETLEREARAQLPAAAGEATLRIRRILEMCYEGQQNAVPVELERWPVQIEDEPSLVERLNRGFESVFGFVPSGRRPQILDVRVFVERVLDVERLLTSPAPEDTSEQVSPRGCRDVLYPTRPERIPTAIFERSDLPSGWRADGPVIIEEDYSNTVVGPDHTVRIDDFGNIVIETARTPYPAGDG